MAKNERGAGRKPAPYKIKRVSVPLPILNDVVSLIENYKLKLKGGDSLEKLSSIDSEKSTQPKTNVKYLDEYGREIKVFKVFMGGEHE